MNHPKLNPLCLTPTDAALLLSKAGGEAVTEAEIQKAIDADAPVESDGHALLQVDLNGAGCRETFPLHSAGGVYAASKAWW